MPFLLAQAPDPSIAWNVILTIGVLVAIGGNLISLVRSGKSQRRDVSILENAVGRDEFDRHTAQNREDHQLLFGKIDKVQNDASDGLKEAINRLEDKIQELPALVLDILRKSNHLK